MTLSERVLGFLARHTVIILLVGLLMLFTMLTPQRFLSGENVSNVARQLSFDTIVAFGQVIVLIVGGIDLSVGSVLAMSAALTMPRGIALRKPSRLAGLALPAASSRNNRPLAERCFGRVVYVSGTTTVRSWPPTVRVSRSY